MLAPVAHHLTTLGTRHSSAPTLVPVVGRWELDATLETDLTNDAPPEPAALLEAVSNVRDVGDPGRIGTVDIEVLVESIGSGGFKGSLQHLAYLLAC